MTTSGAELLALHGGPPVRDSLLPYGRQHIDEADVSAVVEALRAPFITTGPRVAAFERDFGDFVGARHAVSFSSGTAALHGAVFAAGLCAGDEGITTPLTFCATANCLLYQGARPVFADIRGDTLQIDSAEVAERITPRTRAILPVDFGGQPAELDALRELADRNELWMIEDASHAPGARYDGRRVGSISHMTTFSFHPVKHVATGEGGMVTTDDDQLARRLRLFRNHGIESDSQTREERGDWHYEMVALGFNYRLSDIACALGSSQLHKLPENLARRRAIAARYLEGLRDIPGLVLPSVAPHAEPAWHLFQILIVPEALRCDRREIFRALRAEGLGVNVHYIPVHLHPHYRTLGYRPGDLPVAEDAYRRLITLPLFHGMEPSDVSDVLRAVEKVFRFYAA